MKLSTALKRVLLPILLALWAAPALAAGSLLGLPLSQQVDVNGKPLVGAKLYVYTAGTLTPAQVYSDFALSVVSQWPLQADGNGRLPQFWVDDGNYRVRLTTSGGTVVFDTDNVPAIGASSGGGGGDDVDPNALAATGDFKWRPFSGTLSGWVRANGRTIGSATSGASERANSDTQNLYEVLWAGCADAVCTVTGGRGSSADADFSANKPIMLPDMRSKSPFGLDDMGNTAAGRIASGTPTSPATGGGAETFLLPQNQLPNISLDLSGLGIDISGLTITGGASTVWHGGSDTNYAAQAGVNGTPKGASTTSLGVGGSAALTGAIHLNGNVTQQSTNKMPPYMLGSWYVRL